MGVFGPGAEFEFAHVGEAADRGTADDTQGGGGEVEDDAVDAHRHKEHRPGLEAGEQAQVLFGQAEAHRAGDRGEVDQFDQLAAFRVGDLLVVGGAVPVAVVVVERAFRPLAGFPLGVVGAGAFEARAPGAADGAVADRRVVDLAGVGLAEDFYLRRLSGVLLAGIAPGAPFGVAQRRPGQVVDGLGGVESWFRLEGFEAAD
jgi:hypothetical protein